MRSLNISKKFSDKKACRRSAARAALLALCVAACGFTACGSKGNDAGAKPAAEQAQNKVDSLQSKIDSDPKKLQNYIDLHQEYLAEGDYESALQILDDAWEAGVDDPDGKLVNLYTSLIMAVQNNPALMQSEDDEPNAGSQMADAGKGAAGQDDDKKASANFSKPRDYVDDTSYMQLDYSQAEVSEDEAYEYEDKVRAFLLNEDIRHIWEYADGEEKLVIVPGTFSDEKLVEMVSMTIRGMVTKKDLATDSYCENLGKNENGLDEYKMAREEYLGYVDEFFGYDRAEELGEIPDEYLIFTGMGIEDFSEMDLKMSEVSKCDDYVKTTFDVVYKWHYSAREEETRVTQVVAYFTTESDGDYTYHVMLHADEV